MDPKHLSFYHYSQNFRFASHRCFFQVDHDFNFLSVVTYFDDCTLQYTARDPCDYKLSELEYPASSPDLNMIENAQPQTNGAHAQHATPP